MSSPSPHWLGQAELPSILPDPHRTWLFDQQSLTRRLSELSANRFSVALLQQGWQVLRADECAALGIADGSEGWLREVFLLGAGEPWVFARSVASRSALEDSGMDLQSLGERSLGELLFSNPAFTRGELQACRYPAAWLPPNVRGTDYWARRSCFRRDGLGVLVAEAFLPAFWQRLATPT
ncbi:chorismate--pyruvate lyase family protein [Pseudomonas sp. LRF_L74]|uniref:chorismate--pyruvate lyase family protein n=1 Tax=Pseudomonas sp. LRF_L74 TaxID=3369422 RepID=UPI003F601BDD